MSGSDDGGTERSKPDPWSWPGLVPSDGCAAVRSPGFNGPDMDSGSLISDGCWGSCGCVHWRSCGAGAVPVLCSVGKAGAALACRLVCLRMADGGWLSAGRGPSEASERLGQTGQQVNRQASQRCGTGSSAPDQVHRHSVLRDPEQARQKTGDDSVQAGDWRHWRHQTQMETGAASEKKALLYAARVSVPPRFLVSDRAQDPTGLPFRGGTAEAKTVGCCMSST